MGLVAETGRVKRFVHLEQTRSRRRRRQHEHTHTHNNGVFLFIVTKSKLPSFRIERERENKNAGSTGQRSVTRVLVEYKCVSIVVRCRMKMVVVAAPFRALQTGEKSSLFALSLRCPLFALSFGCECVCVFSIRVALCWPLGTSVSNYDGDSCFGSLWQRNKRHQQQQQQQKRRGENKKKKSKEISSLLI